MTSKVMIITNILTIPDIEFIPYLIIIDSSIVSITGDETLTPSLYNFFDS